MLKHLKYISLGFIICLVISCSSSTPTSQNITTSIRNQVQSELSGNQKIVSVSIVEIKDKPGHADLEEPGTENKFWTVTSDIKIKTTVSKKKLPYSNGNIKPPPRR